MKYVQSSIVHGLWLYNVLDQRDSIKLYVKNSKIIPYLTLILCLIIWTLSREKKSSWLKYTYNVVQLRFS